MGARADHGLQVVRDRLEHPRDADRQRRLHRPSSSGMPSPCRRPTSGCGCSGGERSAGAGSLLLLGLLGIAARRRRASSH
jgi:MYXO-CTERM domain-containing protein